jgi:acylglycerol lipase
MRHASDHLIAPDGLRLATRAWIPRGDPTAAVILVHGYAEHIGRHEGLATVLARAGYAVHGLDLRGHGASEGARAQVRRFDQYLADLAAFEREVRSWHPGLPRVLFGHSMGGLIVLRALQERAVRADLVVLSAPLLRLRTNVPAPVARLLLALSEPLPNLPTVGIDPRHISTLPEEAEAYRIDPAVYHGPTKARVAAEMIRNGEIALAQAAVVDAPTLLLHCKDDPMCESSATGQLARALPRATLQLYDHGHHELFHDEPSERATTDLLAWLQARFSPDATRTGAGT